MTYPINRERTREEGERREQRTKSQRGGEGRREWNRGGGQGPSRINEGLNLDICVGVPSCANADGAGLATLSGTV